MSEVLIVIAAENRAQAQAARRQVASASVGISQRYGSNVLIAEVAPDNIPLLKAEPFILGIYEKDVPVELFSHIDEAGIWGVTAWNQRHSEAFRAEKRNRKGQGYSWGHPDFDPEG